MDTVARHQPGHADRVLLIPSRTGRPSGHLIWLDRNGLPFACDCPAGQHNRPCWALRLVKRNEGRVRQCELDYEQRVGPEWDALMGVIGDWTLKQSLRVDALNTWLSWYGDHTWRSGTCWCPLLRSQRLETLASAAPEAVAA